MWLWEIYGFSITFVQGKSRVSKMSGLENPSDAQNKVPWIRTIAASYTKACNWVPVYAGL